jgi:hypothetical protein
MTFIGRAVIFIGGAVTFIGGAVIFINRAMTFVGGAVTFIDKAITFIGKGSLAIKRSFKTAKAGVADNIKINRHNLRQRLITYKLRVPLLLINSLISTSNYSVGLSS